MIRVHPAADLFPMMTDGELKTLAEDIRLHGLRHPVVVYDAGGEWLLLDGRNRLRACQILGAQPAREVWSGEDPIAFIVSTNLHRRHLSVSQRTMVADEIAKLKLGQRKAPDSSMELSVSQAEAAALLNVSVACIKRARRVKEQGVADLVDAVATGKVSVRAAYDVASLSHDEQRALLATGTDAVVARAVELREPEVVPMRKVFARGDGVAKGVADGVVRVKAGDHLPYTPRVNADRHEVVAELTSKGMTVSEIANQTGYGKKFIHDVRARILPKKNILEGAIVDAQTFADTWSARANEANPKWLSATVEERESLADALDECARAAKRMINRLKKEAEKETSAS